MRKTPLSFRIVSFRIVFVCSCFLAGSASAHPENDGEAAATARYIANEGVMISKGDTKILFDPLFRNSFGNYRLPSAASIEAMMAGAPPFDGIDVVFISHSHGDHFSSKDANAFLAGNLGATLVAPEQAVAAMKYVDNWEDAFETRVTSVALERGDAPAKFEFGSIAVSAVRIPHAGWPGRANVQNIVYRVTLDDDVTVMHMGDADVNDEHYAPYKDHWMSKKTDTGFPPYWFFLMPGGEEILKDRLNIQHAVGVHVPVKVPTDLITTGKDFLSEPGETRPIQSHD